MPSVGFIYADICTDPYVTAFPETKNTKVSEIFGSLAEPLTLVTGAKCKDGLVIMADNVHSTENGGIMNLADYPLPEKLTGRLSNVVFGYAGHDLKFDYFERYVLGDMLIAENTREQYSNRNLFCKLSEIVFRINKTVSRSDKNTLGDPNYRLYVLIASKLPDLRLTWINHQGEHQTKEYKSIGSGELFTDFLLRFCSFEPKDHSINDFIELGTFSMLFLETYFPCLGVGLQGKNPLVHSWGLDSSIDKNPDPKKLCEIYGRVEARLKTHGEAIKLTYETSEFHPN